MQAYTQIILQPTVCYDEVYRACRRNSCDVVIWCWELGYPLGSIRGCLTMINFDNTFDEVNKFLEFHNIKIIKMYKVDSKYNRIFN